jgi:hypothetical protein
MTPEDFRHLRTVGLAPGSSIDYFGSFAEVRGAHYRGAYDGELFHILAAEVNQIFRAYHAPLFPCRFMQEWTTTLTGGERAKGALTAPTIAERESVG